MAVTLHQAKDYLRIDFDDDDSLITDLIATATQWCEKYTDWALSVRDIDIAMIGCQMSIYTYPIIITDVVNSNGDTVNYKVTQRPGKVIISAPEGSIIKATIGTTSYPAQFDTAIKKLVVYLYENRDTYNMALPADVQGLINQLRRNIV